MAARPDNDCDPGNSGGHSSGTLGSATDETPGPTRCYAGVLTAPPIGAGQRWVLEPRTSGITADGR